MVQPAEAGDADVVRVGWVGNVLEAELALVVLAVAQAERVGVVTGIGIDPVSLKRIVHALEVSAGVLAVCRV